MIKIGNTYIPTKTIKVKVKAITRNEDKTTTFTLDTPVGLYQFRTENTDQLNHLFRALCPDAFSGNEPCELNQLKELERFSELNAQKATLEKKRESSISK